MTTVVKDIGKCTVCNKHKEPAEFENPLAKRFGICDQCFMHRQRDWEDADLDKRENLKDKAVMSVSSPEEGKTCNCNQGDHSNANGDLHGMYNQEGGRSNWQGQGLPQPSKTCECDEKPAEADKVPNADARISDKDMKEKHSGLVGHPKEDSWKEQRKPELFMSKLDSEGKPLPTFHKRGAKIRQDRKRKDKDYNVEKETHSHGKRKRVLHMSKLDSEGKPLPTFHKYGAKIREDRKNKGRTARNRKRREERQAKVTAGIIALKSVLENIFKKRKTRIGGKGRTRRTGKIIAGHTGKWRKMLTPQQGEGSSTPTNNLGTAANREVASTLGFNTATAGSGFANPKFAKVKPKPESKKRKIRTGAQTKEQSDKDTENTKRQKEAKKGKGDAKGGRPFSKKKKITAGDKEKKRLEAKLSPAVEANVKRVKDLKDNVDSLGRDKRTQHSTSGLKDNKTGTLKLITPQRKKLQRELSKLKLPKEEKKKPVKAKRKPSFPKFSDKKSDLVGLSDDLRLPEYYMSDLDEKGHITEYGRAKKIRNAKRSKRRTPKKLDEHDSNRHRYRVRQGVLGLDKTKAIDDIISDIQNISKGIKKNPAKKLIDDDFWIKAGLMTPDYQYKKKPKKKAESDNWDKNDKKRTEINEGIKEDTNEGGTAAGIGEHNLVDSLTRMLARRSGNSDATQRAVHAALSGKVGKLPDGSTVSMERGTAPFRKRKPKKILGKAEEKCPFCDHMKDYGAFNLNVEELTNFHRQHKENPEEFHKNLHSNLLQMKKAEENQFGAWGQRGLGDGSGTGAIQGSGDTHLITPVKQKDLDKLMRGIRYMPRSVSRKKKP